MPQGHSHREVRVSPTILLTCSPELKKEEWSVYVLDQSVSERKFSGNGTITSVLQEDEPVPIIGKVTKKKFGREILDIELRLVKVLIFHMETDRRFPYLLQRSSLLFPSNSYFHSRCSNILRNRPSLLLRLRYSHERHLPPFQQGVS